MDYRKFNNTIVLRIDKDEEIFASLHELIAKENIKLAKINAIGSTNKFLIGSLSSISKKVVSKQYNGTFEITSLCGNITTMNNKPYIHLHITCSDYNDKVIGGHLLECYINRTCEMIINLIDGEIERKLDETSGLNVFMFKK